MGRTSGHKWPTLVGIVAFSLAPRYAISQSAPISNADVVLMVSQKLDDKIILTSIDSAPTTAFDVTSSGLIQLRKPTPDGKLTIGDRILLEVQKVSAQKQPHLTVTNADVLALVAAGMSQDVIMAAIDTAGSTPFDVSPKGLVDLKVGKVNDNVVKHMQELVIARTAGPPAPPAPSGSAPPAAAPKANPAVVSAAPGSSTSNTAAAGPKPVAKTTAPAKPADAPTAPAAKPTPPSTDGITRPKGAQGATFTVAMTMTNACNKVRQYFVSNEVELDAGTDCTVGQIRTRPVNKQGWIKSDAKRVVVNFIEAGPNTEVRLKVIDKGSGFFSVNGGKQDAEKTEAVSVNDSMQFAAMVRDYLRSTPQAATQK